MASYLHKTADPTIYHPTGSDAGHQPIGDWFRNPDISAVTSVEQKYWARPLTDPVTEMSQPEKDAVDAAEATAVTESARDAATAPTGISDDAGGMLERGLIELLNKRDNFLTTRVIELQDRVQAMLDSTGAADNMRTDGLAVPISSTATRPRSDAINDYRLIVQSGQVDDGEPLP